MALVITGNCQIYWNYQVWTLSKGTAVPDGEFATFLRSAGGVPVEEVESGPAVDVDGDGVPDGTIAQVLEWVGDDRDRARAALDAERAGRNRPRLVSALNQILEG